MRRSISAVLWLGGLVAISGMLPLPTVAAQGRDRVAHRSAGRIQAPEFIPLISDAKAPAKWQGTVQLDAKGWTLAQVLDEVAQQLGVDLMYDTLVLGRTPRITGEFEKVTGAHVILLALRRTGLQLEVTEDGSAARVRRVDGSSRTTGIDTTGTIVGQVTDASTKRGVSKVGVFLDGTPWRTVTDTNGRYRLAAVDPGAYTLVTRRLGYAKRSRTMTVRAAQEDTVDVALEPVVTRLNELVTTATGPRRRLDIANDITTINADSVMQAAPIRNVTDILEGRVPGLTVQRTSGAPGDPSRLRLRGASSINGINDPIVIVDGVRMFAQQSARRSENLATQNAYGAFAANGYATPSPLDNIDPNSIETIEVVKGPSAATLYGQDAANGVILITTKKGRAGPARWTATLDQGRTTLAGAYPDLLFSWGHLIDRNETVNCGLSAQVATGCVVDSIKHYQLLNDPALTPLSPGHRTAASLGVSGGSSSLTYNVTGSYQQEVGLPRLPDYEVERYQAQREVPPPDWMRRPQHLTQWQASSQITAKLGSQAEVALTSSLARTVQQRSSLERQLGNLMTTYFDPTFGLYYQNGQSIGDNTAAILNDYVQRATSAGVQFRNGANLSWRPRSWAMLTADAGLDVQQRNDEIFLPPGYGVDTSGNVAIGRGTVLTSTVNLRGSAQARLPLGMQFHFAAGVNYVGTSVSDQSLQTRDFAAGSDLLGGTLLLAFRREQDAATFGWYIEPSIGNSKFNFTSGLRLDGGKSAGTGSGLQLPKFPKLGFSYLLSDEPFFPFKDLFQVFRLRVAYGRASSLPGDNNGINGQERVYMESPVWVNGQSANAALLAALGNSQLRPERSTELEGGFDADLLKGRLTITFSGYRKTTDDAVFSAFTPGSVYGGVDYLRNIGVTRNTGIEFTVGGQLLRSSAVTWGTQLYVSQRRGLVVKLGPGVFPYYPTHNGSASAAGNNGGVRIAAGYPIGAWWALPIAGYADANGNGVLEPSEIVLGDTAVYVGAPEPSYTATISTDLSLWHGAVKVTAAFLYEGGLVQVNSPWQYLSAYSRGRIDPTTSLAEQLVAYTPRELRTDYNIMQVVNTFRFNSLTVRYTVPVLVARRLGAQAIDISLQGGNLGLWTNYRGLDPNVNDFTGGNYIADPGELPQPRTWQVRVHATY